MLDCDVDANPEPSIAWYKDVQTDGSGVPRLQVRTRTINEANFAPIDFVLCSCIRHGFCELFLDDLSYNNVLVFILFPITY